MRRRPRAPLFWHKLSRLTRTPPIRKPKQAPLKEASGPRREARASRGSLPSPPPGA
jgi:hypothetical protein